MIKMGTAKSTKAKLFTKVCDKREENRNKINQTEDKIGFYHISKGIRTWQFNGFVRMNAITLANDLRNSIFHNVNYYFTEEKKTMFGWRWTEKIWNDAHGKVTPLSF